MRGRCRRSSLLGRAGLVFLAAAAACDRSATEPPARPTTDPAPQAGPVAAIWPWGGNLQVAEPGTRLPRPLRVRVQDRRGNPVSGARVTFTVISGEGTLADAVATADAGAYAGPGPWTLGPEVGRQQVRAESNGHETIFEAYAERWPSDFVTLAPTCSAAPDCGALAFVSVRDGNPEIYSIRPDGTGLSRLTNDEAIDADPAWAPDGRRIAFASDRSGSWEIYVMDADGSNVSRRTFAGRHSVEPSWSPDGSRIVYTGDGDIWQVGPDGDVEPTPVFTERGVDQEPAWSPDGTRLAFVSDWNAFDFVSDVFLVGADGSGRVSLTDNIFDRLDYVGPAWSPDGAVLAVTIREEIGVDRYVGRIGVMAPDGSDLRPLASAAPGGSITWSPDGELLVYASTAGATVNVSWIRADGSDGGVLLQNAHSPAWSR